MEHFDAPDLYPAVSPFLLPDFSDVEECHAPHAAEDTNAIVEEFHAAQVDEHINAEALPPILDGNPVGFSIAAGMDWQAAGPSALADHLQNNRLELVPSTLQSVPESLFLTGAVEDDWHHRVASVLKDPGTCVLLEWPDEEIKRKRVGWFVGVYPGIRGGSAFTENLGGPQSGRVINNHPLLVVYANAKVEGVSWVVKRYILVSSQEQPGWTKRPVAKGKGKAKAASGKPADDQWIDTKCLYLVKQRDLETAELGRAGSASTSGTTRVDSAEELQRHSLRRQQLSDQVSTLLHGIITAQPPQVLDRFLAALTDCTTGLLDEQIVDVYRRGPAHLAVTPVHVWPPRSSNAVIPAPLDRRLETLRWVFDKAGGTSKDVNVIRKCNNNDSTVLMVAASFAAEGDGLRIFEEVLKQANYQTLMHQSKSGWTVFHVLSTKGHERALREALHQRLPIAVKKWNRGISGAKRTSEGERRQVVDVGKLMFHINSRHYKGQLLEALCLEKGWAIRRASPKPERLPLPA